MLQKFDTIEVVGNNLVIHYKDKEVKCKIKGDAKRVVDITSTINKLELFTDDTSSIAELKSLSAFDKVHQAKLKSYIDDLVFALYFKVNLTKLGFVNAEQIKSACSKQKYYKLVNPT
jgi:hypothetical protein